MEVKMMTSIAQRNEQTGKIVTANYGDVIDVPEATAKRLVAMQLAVMVTPKRTRKKQDEA